MKGLIALKKAFVFFLIHFIIKPLKWLIQKIHKFGGSKIIVWIYRPFRLIKRRFNKAFLPGKSKVLTLFANRYIIHFVLIFAAIFIFGINIQAKEINVENFGKDSIMSQLVSQELGQSTEDVLSTQKISTQSSYLRLAFGNAFVEYGGPAYSSIHEEMGRLTEGGSVLIKPDITSTKRGERPREKIIVYEVLPGENPGIIAEKFYITVSTILIENDLGWGDIIRPGQKITILQTSGISYKIKKGDTLASVVKKYNGNIDEIINVNKLVNENDIYVGQKITIPGGKIPPAPKPAYSSYTGGIPPSAMVSGTDRMVWPTSGKRITQYYHWRHLGLDIDGTYSSPIYAADGGYIEAIGWGTGYGNRIIINHGNGKKTLYAHMSKFYVKRGETVSRGQTIGMMGSTGWSTGTHLHFEVQISGVKKNPLGYIR
jgi:LysM repeat protein